MFIEGFYRRWEGIRVVFGERFVMVMEDEWMGKVGRGFSRGVSLYKITVLRG